MTIIKKRILLIMFALVCAITMMGFGIGNIARADDAEPLNLGDAEFAMVDGVELKFKTGADGVRFKGKLSKEDYDGLLAKYAKVEFGMFIMPEAYLELGEINEYNTFGGGKFDVNADYGGDATVGTGLAKKYRIIHMNVQETIDAENEEVFVQGSVHSIKSENLAINYTASAYIKATDEAGKVSYKFATEVKNTGSVVDMALRAIDSGDYDDSAAKKAVLDGYVNNFKSYYKSTHNNTDPTFSYTLQYVVTGGNGTPVAIENAVAGNAMDSDLTITPTAPEGYILDTRAEYWKTAHIYASDITIDVNVNILLDSKDDIDNLYEPSNLKGYYLTSDIIGGHMGGTGQFNGIIDGQGHVVRDVTDDGGWGILGFQAFGHTYIPISGYDPGFPYPMTVKDVAFVNVSGSAKNMLSYHAYSVEIDNVFISGTCYYHDIFEYAYGDETLQVKLNNVILDCYCIRDKYPLGKTGEEGSNNVIYNNVIQLDKYGVGLHGGSSYDGAEVLTYDEFFAKYADGLPAEWSDSGFTVENDTLYFHGKAVMSKGAVKLGSAEELTDLYRAYGDTEYKLTKDIVGGTMTHSGVCVGTFSGVLDGDGHVIKDAIDGGNWGVLGYQPDGATLKDIALVNVSGSVHNLLAYEADDITIENAYISGTCAFGALFSTVHDKGATFNYVILNCTDTDGNPLEKAGTSGGENVTFNNVIVIDADFFTTYADGLGEEWAARGFTVENNQLKFHGTTVYQAE